MSLEVISLLVQVRISARLQKLYLKLSASLDFSKVSNILVSVDNAFPIGHKYVDDIYGDI
jgi:hypothetical protein